MRFKRFSIILLIVILLVSIIGCTNKQSEEKDQKLRDGS